MTNEIEVYDLRRQITDAMGRMESMRLAGFQDTDEYQAIEVALHTMVQMLNNMQERS